MFAGLINNIAVPPTRHSLPNGRNRALVIVFELVCLFLKNNLTDFSNKKTVCFSLINF